MRLSNETLSILVFVALGLSGLALFILAMISPKRRPRPEVFPPDERAQASLEEHARAIAALRGGLKGLTEEDGRLREALGGAVQRVGLVRYDAFDDMGGRLSFSLALLNRAGDGVVVTSINGRSDTRVYAKPVQGGESRNVSEEEAEAIQQAMAGSSTSTVTA